MIEAKDGKAVVRCDGCGEVIDMFGSFGCDGQHFCDEGCSTPANQEFRICQYCGQPMIQGYTVEGGFWYCCEKCFGGMLESDYPNGWRVNDHDDDPHWIDGYYDYKDDEGNWHDTGIFYTEWY